MKIVLISATACSKCKIANEKLECISKEHQIEYSHVHIPDAPLDIITLLKENKVLRAPAMIVYEGDAFEIYSGDDVLEKINEITEKFS